MFLCGPRQLSSAAQGFRCSLPSQAGHHRLFADEAQLSAMIAHWLGLPLRRPPTGWRHRRRLPCDPLSARPTQGRRCLFTAPQRAWRKYGRCQRKALLTGPLTTLTLARSNHGRSLQKCDLITPSVMVPLCVSLFPPSHRTLPTIFPFAPTI